MPNLILPYTPPNGPQTRVDQFPNIGLNGTLADCGNHTISSVTVETGGFDVGVAVALGVGGYGFGKALAASGDVANVIGWSMFKPMMEPSVPRFLATNVADVVRKGRLWVLCQGATVDLGPAFVIYSGASAGQLRGDASSGGTAALQVTRATVLQGAAAGGLALLDINMP